jgi:hypothetical protein
MKLVCMIIIIIAIYYANVQTIDTVTNLDEHHKEQTIMRFSIGYMDPSTFDQSYNRKLKPPLIITIIYQIPF